MLRMALLGLLILLSVGVLSAMELRAPSRRAIESVQPLAEPSAGISASHGALAKADRVEIVAVSSEVPTQAALVEERIAPPEDISTGSSQPPRQIAGRQHNSNKIAAAARPKPKPKATGIKRTAIFQHPKAASDTGPCRLKAFGGLRKALNLAGCEI